MLLAAVTYRFKSEMFEQSVHIYLNIQMALWILVS